MEYQLIKSPFQNGTKLSIVEELLTNRGINLENVNHYLNTTDGDILNPAIIANIHEGAKMLVQHIHKGDKVLIQIDSDADGFTSAALLINYLNCLFPAFVKNNISYRLHTGKQHGIVLESIPDDVKLVIAPDSSSNDYEIHEALKARGVDVLVIDHHDAEKVS
jgi:single-stranded-DNA-specific exonuclease